MSWDERAACRSIGEAGDEFFPTPHGSTRAVLKSMCAWCPVREECLEAGLSSEWMPSGVWGGVPEADVIRMWRRRKRASRVASAS